VQLKKKYRWTAISAVSVISGWPQPEKKIEKIKEINGL
jgi:hypothetical protein